MNIIFRPLLLALCVSPFSAPAALVSNYAVVYDNGVPVAAATNGRTNDPDYPIYIEHADNFSLSATSMVQGVLWASTYEGNFSRPDNFVLRIYPLVSGTPSIPNLYSIPLEDVERLDTDLTNALSQQIFSYQAFFPDMSLDAGTYAISIYNDADDGFEWFWADRDSPAVDGSFMFLSVWGEWRQFTGGPEFSFSLISVTEPSLSIMAAGGLCVLLGRRTRRTKGVLEVAATDKRRVESGPGE